MESIDKRAEVLLLQLSEEEARFRAIGGPNADNTLATYRKVRSLVDNMAALERKAKEIETADLSVKYRFSLKVKKAGKEFWRLVREINALHKKGELDEAPAKQFGKILEKVKAKNLGDAKKGMAEFKKLELLSARTSDIRKDIKTLEQETDSRINALSEKLSEQCSAVPKKELERRAAEFNRADRILARYSAWRDAQVERFKAMPAGKLIRACSGQPELFMMGFPRPKDDFAFEELGDHLLSSKIGGRAEDVLKMAEMGIKELKSKVGDHHLFRRLVSENSDWLESAVRLERSDFLRFEFGSKSRAEGILRALKASKKDALAKEISGLTLSKADYESGKEALMLLEKSKQKGETPQKPNPKQTRTEIASLRRLKQRLASAGGSG